MEYDQCARVTAVPALTYSVLRLVRPKREYAPTVNSCITPVSVKNPERMQRIVVVHVIIVFLPLMNLNLSWDIAVLLLLIHA